MLDDIKTMRISTKICIY